MRDGIAYLVRLIFTETQLVDGKCPDCGREVKKNERRIIFL